MDTNSKGHLEASFAGFGFGAILGGLVIGAATDLAGSPVNPMLGYFLGGIAGAVAGLIAGRIAAKVLL